MFQTCVPMDHFRLILMVKHLLIKHETVAAFFGFPFNQTLFILCTFDINTPFRTHTHTQTHSPSFIAYIKHAISIMYRVNEICSVILWATVSTFSRTLINKEKMVYVSVSLPLGVCVCVALSISLPVCTARICSY